MNRFKYVRMFTIFLLFVTFTLITTTYAEDVKARMQARIHAIKELKGKGLVGENNKGYLEFVGSERKGEDVVNAENNDRKEVYAAIAAQQGTSVDIVGKRRAEQIASKAAPGEWVQDANGKWIKK